MQNKIISHSYKSFGEIIDKTEAAETELKMKVSLISLGVLIGILSLVTSEDFIGKTAGTGLLMQNIYEIYLLLASINKPENKE